MANERKAELLEEIKEKLKENENFILTDYRGLTVQQINELRNNLREKGVIYSVVKNNLFRIAVEGKNIKGLDEYLVGPTAVAFSQDDIVSPSKVLIDFAKNSKLEVKGGYFEGEILNSDDVKEYSTLPSKEVLVSRLLGALTSPIRGLLHCINDPIRKVVYLLSEVSKTK